VGKAPLTQYLGLPEDLQMLEPSVAEIEHKEGYKYLLCSDGVTDMLSDREIEEILSGGLGLSEMVDTLLQTALDKGGRDNVTIVLCEVQKLDTVRMVKTWMKNLKDKK
jgi:serine/threonine protein phosphatase PrpC